MITKILLLCILLTGFVAAQEKYAESYVLLQETMRNCATIVEAARTNDLEVVKIEVDLIGSASKLTLKAMNADFSYALRAYGSTSRIADLDIEIYSADGVTLLKKDVGNTALAMVSFTPPESGYFIIKVIAYKMMPGYADAMGQFCLVVAHN